MAHLPTVLVIDDDPSLCAALTLALEDEWDVQTVPTGREGLARLAQEPIPVVLLDIRLPEMDGLAVLRSLKAQRYETEVLMLTAIHEVAIVVEAMQHGATDFVTKPFEVDTLRQRLHQALMRGRAQRPAALDATLLASCDMVIGQSRVMPDLWDTLSRIADTDATVLLTGESGTGKEHLARALHQQSRRRTGPFVAIDCGALPPGLVESALFGYERGAFTGAERQHRGKFEQAQHGTLFLDEISNLPPAAQAALLRVLQTRTVQRLGGETTRPVDVRVAAATNDHLERLVVRGTFRQDLFYRLYVVPLVVPPLRTRRGDIPLFVTHFLRKYNREHRRQVEGLTAEALAILTQYAWPGNVRELENLISRLVALNRQPLLTATDVREALELAGSAPTGDRAPRDTETAQEPHAVAPQVGASTTGHDATREKRDRVRRA